MSLRVFLSSTREDLDTDCRPSVVTGIKIGEAELVEMDSWDADHEDPVILCQCKIRDRSSHYLGLFGYRRGWAPPVLQKSITEAEYDWALEYRQPTNMVVFLPMPGTELDLKLRERARNQTPDEELAQADFLKRVRQRSCQPFESLQELSCRVTRKLWSWKGGGLRAIAATPAAPPPSRPRPTEEDVFNLGRKRHQLQFEETLELLLARPAPRVAGFLIHGPKGHGHEALTCRLSRLLEKSFQATLRHIILHLGVPWQGNSRTALLSSLAKKLGMETAPDSLEKLAKELESVLQTSDVLLEIRQVQKFDGGLESFVTDFWRPLAAQIKQPCPHRFIGFITHVEDHVEDLAGECDFLLQSPPTQESDPLRFDVTKLVRLPRLDAFTRGEIALWLPRWFPNHESVAQYLMDETRGHPVDLFQLLKDDALWTA